MSADHAQLQSRGWEPEHDSAKVMTRRLWLARVKPEPARDGWTWEVSFSGRTLHHGCCATEEQARRVAEAVLMEVTA